jgi:hypothetical protein
VRGREGGREREREGGRERETLHPELQYNTLNLSLYTINP